MFFIELLCYFQRKEIATIERKNPTIKVFNVKQMIPVFGYKYAATVDDEMVVEISSNSFIANLDKYVGTIIGLPFDFAITHSHSGEKMILKRTFSFFFNQYQIFKEEKLIASIKMQKTSGVPKIFINSIYGEYIIETNPTAKKFDIKKDDLIVASGEKRIFSLSDFYEIINYDLEDDLFLITLVCSFDNMF
ncbi:hypothetical protein [Marinilactibacillus kalidii]|uniref:hypothetical protein n=1 Tax=Marinilactibacillus kalidii TaxID=2820274 RepID=UPI001ABDD338|nr:hypothetical protein [Marinilactibacillus kalidii]